MANKTISPVLSLDDDGKASILFVLPCLRRPGVEKILEEPSSQQFFKVISKVIKSYACITIKPDVGTWSDDETEAKIKENEHRIADAVGKYKPKCVVVLGGNLAKMLIPEIRKSKYDLRGTFSNYRMTNRKNIMAMIWGTPDRVINDYQEYVRMPETLAKLSMFAKNKKYHNLPIIHNLDTFKAAKEYIDFLAHEHTGIIGFDTETYSLNRVHNTRLGSMQFCHDDKEAYVLLWDSKHQKLTQQERNKLVPSITNLFGSKDTKFEAWTMHNAEFDIMQMFAEFKTRTYKPIFDTMLFAHLMDENRKHTSRVWLQDNGPYSLKTLVQEFLAFFHYSDEAMKARSSGSIMDLPLEPFLEYSGSDPIVTYRLYHVFKAWAKLEKYDELVLRLMRCLHSRALKMYADVSRTGVLVDKDNLKLTMSKESVINKRLFEINETYKTIPEIQAVNREIAEGMADTSMFFKVPWVFDMNKPSHRNVLFFHSRKGFKFPANEDGKFSSDKKFQKKYASANKAVEMFQESQGLVKLRNSYVKPIFDALLRNPDAKSDICDGRVHPQFHLGRTVTGRTASSNPNCIAEGTRIEVVRDLANNPKGIKIEDVKVGDLVYCYDRKCNLALRKVTAVMDNGVQECLRVYWKSNSHKKQHEGYLDLTPDHKVRLTTGKYKAAQDLNVGDHVLSLSRGMSDEYSVLLPTGHRSVDEHAFVWQATHKNKKKKAGYHVHHIDGTKTNNTADNLVLLSTAEHLRAHAALNSVNGKTYKKGVGEFTAKRLLDSKFALLRFLFACGGAIKNCRAQHVDFYSVKNALNKHGVNWNAAAFRFGADGTYISKARLSAMCGVPSDEASQLLRIGTRRMKDLCSFYRIPYGTLSSKSYTSTNNVAVRNAKSYRMINNHVITKIVHLPKKRRVFDLTVAGCHNFIANEICVHNCQQVPRSDSPVKKGIKAMFIPSPGKILIQADLSAAEVRVWGALSGDTRICQLSRDAMKLRAAVRENPNDKKLRDEAELKADFHKQTYGLCFNKSPSDVTKTERQDAKKLSFGMMYGMSDAGLAREIGKEMDEVMDIKSRFFGVYEVGSAWFGKTQEFALENGYIQTPLGRRRRMPQVFSGDKGLISEAKRFAVNAPIQATASDYAMLAVSILHEYIIDNNLEEHMKILVTVHDSVVLEVTETAEWVQFASKLVRRVFTKDVVKVLKRDFDFELLAPIDIDIEVSQQYIHSCPKCGNKQYIGEGNTCKGTIKTGKKKPDGSAETGPCGCTDLKLQKVGGGWGWLMSLEENAQGVAKAMKGITIEQPKRKSEKSKMAAHK